MMEAVLKCEARGQRGSPVRAIFKQVILEGMLRELQLERFLSESQKAFPSPVLTQPSDTDRLVCPEALSTHCPMPPEWVLLPVPVPPGMDRGSL